MAFSFTYPTPLPSTKGWGPGWPNCQRDKIIQHPIFQGGVHQRILRLCGLIVDILHQGGYRFEGGDSWGFGCRATKGGSGDVPSFHSWGLALDFNAQQNVFGAPASTSDLATNNKWVVALMKDLGFFWLGPDIKDWMHFSFVGSPADADAMTLKAERMLDDMHFDDFWAGWKANKEGKSKPTDNIWKQRGWVAFEDATKPAPAASHKHTYSGVTGEGQS